MQYAKSGRVKCKAGKSCSEKIPQVSPSLRWGPIQSLYFGPLMEQLELCNTCRLCLYVIDTQIAA